MISLILPYWSRQEATTEALWSMVRQYWTYLDLEIIVVDDGSPVPFVKPIVPLDIKVVRLKTKHHALNPCVCYNEGVAKSQGDYIALSNPENLHRADILHALQAEITTDLTYVTGAAWCAEQNRWHCHSSMVRRNDNDVGAYVPAGAQYHFMSMMKRSLWDKIGGFDEDYRDGAGYDDPDLVRRLHRAGAVFKMRDDLVVEHVRAGAHSAWTPEGFARNRAIFLNKWEPIEQKIADLCN